MTIGVSPLPVDSDVNDDNCLPEALVLAWYSIIMNPVMESRSPEWETRSLAFCSCSQLLGIEKGARRGIVTRLIGSRASESVHLYPPIQMSIVKSAFEFVLERDKIGQFLSFKNNVALTLSPISVPIPKATLYMAELNGQHIDGDNEVSHGDKIIHTTRSCRIWTVFNWDIASLNISKFTHRHQSWQASLVCTKI